MNPSQLSSFIRCIGLSLCLTMVATGEPLAWNLPAQPANEALQRFSRLSGWQVLFSARELAGVTSSPVRGEHEPLVALKHLLDGTNFEGIPTGESRVVVRARPLSAVSGVVLVGAPARPVAGAVVEFEATGHTTLTDRNGRFQLMRVPAGTYVLVVRSEGSDQYRLENVEVGAGLRVELKPITIGISGKSSVFTRGDDVVDERLLLRLEDMVITPSRFGVADSLSAASATLSHGDLEVLPQLGEDLYRAIGRLPGFATTDFSAKFWVRGAPNEQVLARLDGMTLLEPYHMKDFDGALSIIDIETVARLDLLSGGFTAEYGDRLAGVLLMETESHLPGRSHTTLGLSLTGVRATNRGSFAEGKGNWMLSGRMGYPEYVLEALDTAGNLKPRYFDAFAKVEYQVRPGQLLAMHVLHSTDTFRQRDDEVDDLRTSYANDNLWMRWRAEFDGGVKGETVLSYALLDWRRQGHGMFDRELPFELDDDRELHRRVLRSDWSWLVRDTALLRGGFEVTDALAEYEYHRLRSVYLVRDGALIIEPRLLSKSLRPERVSTGSYAALRVQPASSVTFEPGLRYDRSDDGFGGDWSPRLNAAWELEAGTLRAAWGRYRQEQGLHEIAVQDGQERWEANELAEHRVVGWEGRIGRGLGFRAELYQRITRNPRAYGINPLNVDDPLGELMIDRRFVRPVEARADGLELSVEGQRGDTFDWRAGYALSRSVEMIDGREVPRARDQRHAFQADVVWRPNLRWQFTAAWQYHSGWPTTAEVFTDFSLDDGRVVTGRFPGPLHGERLPAYHRLDLRATRLFKLPRGTLRVFVDIFNAYNQDNVRYTQSVIGLNGTPIPGRVEVEKNLPILPTLGLIWDF